jgi:hypothetical protein
MSARRLRLLWMMPLIGILASCSSSQSEQSSPGPTQAAVTGTVESSDYQRFLELNKERRGYDNGLINREGYVQAMAESFCAKDAKEQEVLSFVALARNELSPEEALDWVLNVVDAYCPEKRELVVRAGTVAHVNVDDH